jgi:hypothetical protein
VPAPAINPKKRRRMVNVLDVVLRSLKVATPDPMKLSKDKDEELKSLSTKVLLLIALRLDLRNAGQQNR